MELTDHPTGVRTNGIGQRSTYHLNLTTPLSALDVAAPLSFWTQERRRLVLRWWNSGKELSEIVRLFGGGVTPKECERVAHAMGGAIKRKPPMHRLTSSIVPFAGKDD